MEKKSWIDQAVQVASDSGRHINTFTVALITLMVYTIVTAASIDHAAILLDSKVTPPPLNATVSVQHFTLSAAIILVTLHFYILLNLAALRDQIGSIREADVPTPTSEGPRVFAYPVMWVMHLPGREIKDRVRHGAMVVLYILVYVVAPLTTLVILQLVMLPSHRTVLATVITGAMFLDALIIAISLPLQFGYNFARLRRWFNRGFLVVMMGILVAIEVAMVHWPFTGWSWGPVQRNLSVSSQDLQEVDGALELKHRDLRGGHFVGIDLSHADLRGADLRDANFTSAVMKDATFLPASISRRQWEQWTEQQQRAEIERIQAETCQPRVGEECEDDWDENLTRLEGANFSNADLTSASLAITRLSDVNLTGATLTTADLSGAMGQRTDLDRVQADRAKLFLAQLDGASVSHADLWQADLRGVSAVGASFLGTDLGGAQLRDGVFQAAVLVDVKAQAADLTGASLQGADLRGAKLMGTTGLHLQQVIATHVDLSRAEVDPIGGQSALLVDLRAARQDDLARRGPALIIEPELVKGKDDDDVVIQPYPQSILVDPQGWPRNPLGIRELYCKMALALQELEVAQQAGSVPGSYLSAALEEIAHGERVPRIQALEKALGDDKYCQDVGSR